MKVALAVRPSAVAFLDAHLAYHLNAGVDVVIATGAVVDDDVREVVARYAREGYLVTSAFDDIEATARLAVADHAADWLIASQASEFWWPRGAHIGEVLIAIPPRYGVVQALVREFLRQDGEASFAERMTVRDSLAEAVAGPQPLLDKLRPIWRLEPHKGLHRGQPLRAWYPFEVFRYATNAPPAASAELQAGLENGSLVVDERLRDVMRLLSDGSTYQIPSSRPLVLQNPTVVDDALYAVECAAVGEVNLDRLDRQIRELEARLAELESRFWPRMRRLGSRVVGGRRRRGG